MLTLEVQLLTGRYTATVFNDRAKAEWPPHPARIYSALVAALHDEPSPPEEEEHALAWLANAGAPSIVASGAETRAQSVVYVPTNDATALRELDPRRLGALVDAEAALAAARDDKARTKAQKKRDSVAAKLLDYCRQQAERSTCGADSAAEVLPGGRSRQPRTFPTALPDQPVVHLSWPADPASDVVDALDRVAARVARLGHSSSLVSMRFTAAPPADDTRTKLVPDERGATILRVPSEGQLQRLRDAHAQHQQVQPRMLPAAFVAYADEAALPVETTRPTGAFGSDDWLVFQVVPPPDGGRRRLLSLPLAEKVARALRGTLIRAADGDLPEALSGHTADGAPAARPHLAYVPLADVGHPHASGTILGVALVPPRDLTPADRETLWATIARAEDAGLEADDPLAPGILRLVLGRAGEVHLRRLTQPAAAKTLQPERWTRPARRWASASAIALDRNPGDLNSRDAASLQKATAAAEDALLAACERQGLPRPAAVWIHRRPLPQGCPKAGAFMPFPARGRGPRRVCVHAELLFDEPVEGPLLLGAGRYFGLGLFVPRGDR